MDSLASFFDSTLGRRFAGFSWREMSPGLATNRIFCAPDETDLVLKQLASPAAAEREARGLGEWGPAAGWRSPRLVAVDPKHRVIVMEQLRGAGPFAEADLTEALWMEAGRKLRRLHELDLLDDDSVPLHLAWPRRLESSMQKAHRAGLEGGRLRRLEHELGAFDYPVDTVRRPCHRDYRPRNWMHGGDAGDLAIIDFEQSRFDDPLVDFVRLLEDGARPAENSGAKMARAAFFTGYGRVLQREEEERLRILSLRHALDTLIWARRHEDVRFVTSAEARLRSLGI
jgi:tRNA A-37 threonylcarbamoyl transferase component Bud32